MKIAKREAAMLALVALVSAVVTFFVLAEILKRLNIDF